MKNRSKDKKANKPAIPIDRLDEDTENNKMVLVVRTDLKMGKGKIAAQCCHAAVALYDMIMNEKKPQGEKWRAIFRRWEDIGAKKVVTKVNTEKELYF